MPVKKITSSARKLANSKTRKTSKESASEAASKRANQLSIPVYSIDGKEEGVMKLPEEVFGGKVNKQLLAQAVRVYTTNEKTFTASTKTRGQVEGSKIKIFRQKGTGRARHGGITAPIFVGGGIVFGPKPRKVTLDLPKKMKKSGLLSAFSDKVNEELVFGITGTEKLTGKTRELVQFLDKAIHKDRKVNSILMVTSEPEKKLHLAARNIPHVRVLPINLLNIYEVIRHQALVLTKEAVEKLGLRVKDKGVSEEEVKSQKSKVKRKVSKEKVK